MIESICKQNIDILQNKPFCKYVRILKKQYIKISYIWENWLKTMWTLSKTANQYSWRIVHCNFQASIRTDWITLMNGKLGNGEIEKLDLQSTIDRFTNIRKNLYWEIFINFSSGFAHWSWSRACQWILE